MTREKVGDLYAELGIEVDAGMLAKAKRAIDSVGDQARKIPDGSVGVNVHVDDAELGGLGTKLDGLDSEVIEPKVDIDTDRANREIDHLAMRSDELRSLFGTIAFGAGLKYAVDQASDLNEATNVTGLIFKDARGEIDEFVKSSAKLGFSEATARELTGSIGGLLLNLGLTSDETVEWSKRLLGLGADMGSAFNEDPARAVEAIGAALRGETEPIRAFNVVLDDATISQKAVEMGLAATTAEVDKGAKARAALQLITEQTAAVEGDFANTSDQAANAQRVARAEIDNAAASLGSSLLPALADGAQAAGFLAREFASLPDPIQTAVLAMAGIAAVGPTIEGGLRDAAGTAREIVSALGDVPKIEGAGGMLKTIGTTVAAYPVPFLAAAAGVVGLGAALIQMADDGNQAAAAAKTVAERAQELGTTATEVMAAQLANSLAGFDGKGLENFGRSADNTRQALVDLHIDATDLTTALFGNEADYEALVDQIEAVEKANRGESNSARLRRSAALQILDVLPSLREQYDLATASDEKAGRIKAEVNAATSDYIGINEDAAGKASGWWAKVDAHTGSLMEQIYAYDELNAAVRTQQALVGDAFDAQSAYQSSIFGVQDAQSALAEARAKGDPKEIARAEQRLTEAVVRQSEAKVTLAQKEAEVEGATLTAIEATSMQREALEALAEQLGLTDPELQTLIERLKEAEKDYVVGLTTTEATAEAKKLREELEKAWVFKTLLEQPGPGGPGTGTIGYTGDLGVPTTTPPTRDPDTRTGRLLPGTNVLPATPTTDTPTPTMPDDRVPVGANGGTTHIYLGSASRQNRDGLWERAA